MRPGWLELMGYETFDDVEDIQYYKKIKIKISFPFCAVSFDKIDFDEACQVTAIKFLGGFNDDSDFSRIIYLNKTKINNAELFLWNKKEIKENFINKYNKILKDNNEFTIKLANKGQYEYIRHLVIIDHKDYFKNS